MSSDPEVHVGFWTNWSKGAVLGSTLTLPNRNGGVLVAALAIFIQLAGRQSWNIVCFIAHQIRTTKEARDGSFHQEQAILRNNSSDLNSLWQFSKIWWSWRSISSWRARKSLGLILVGVLHLLAFGAAGILAFHITTVGNQVLLASSSSCGPWYPLLEPLTSMNISLVDDFQSYLGLIAASSEEYVQNCLSGPQASPECSKYQVSKLNWTSIKTHCPFGGLCLGPSNGSLQMATALLDSRTDLGINGRDEDRVQLKKTATCVPIAPDSYTHNGTTSINYDSFTGAKGEITVNYTAVYYGPSTTNSTLIGITDPALQNMTYLYTNFRDAATPFHNTYVSSYDLDLEIADADSSWASFSPIAALAPINSTLEMMFVSFYGSYTGPSDDLWMPAHKKISDGGDETGAGNSWNAVTYIPDRTVSALACTEQFQICNPSSGHLESKCTPLQSLIQINNYTKEDFQTVLRNDRQVAISFALAAAAYYSSIYVTVPSLTTSLLANKLSSGGLSMPLAPNQWELESSNWFTIGLAEIQQLMVSYITGPPSQFVSWVPQNQGNHDPALKWLCESQIIRRNDFTNFSTLSISLIFGFGTILICCTLWLETFVGWLRGKYPRWKSGMWRQRSWWAEGTLQLQRRVFQEEMMIENWEPSSLNKVPVTDTGRLWRSMKSWEEGGSLIQGQKEDEEGMKEISSPTDSGTWLNDDKVLARLLKRPASHRGFMRTRSNSL
ncbi:hypothetical protein N431DRAFT_467074 [Stipitochalara longipes BDJ]|nr:hypothetical protein N431DRAFT_467074 [Stipitochalara longipes BDJ]